MVVAGPWTTAGMERPSLAQPERPIRSGSTFDEKTCSRGLTCRSDFGPCLMFLCAPLGQAQNSNTLECHGAEPCQESQVNWGQRY